jgi:hypothetical protein
MYCCYYQAEVYEKECWFLVAVLRSFEHLAFDRTLDKTVSIFEFFVPAGNERVFLELMTYFKTQGVIFKLEKKENRLISELL